MLTKRIIPCLDVKEGRVVKGVNFLNLQDAGDPVEAAKEYDRQGADELVFLDITASVERRNILIDVVERTANEVFMPLTVGGGVRTVEDMRQLLLAGADKVAVNTQAVKRPEVISEGALAFGSQCIVAAVDVKRRNKNDASQGWEVYIYGGRENTGLDAILWIENLVRQGAGEILLTSMDCDGTKQGYDIELTRAVSSRVTVPVIASGGAGTVEHLADVLKLGNADAVLAASIFHYQELTVGQVKQALKKQGIMIRP
jgi:cyclase